MNEPLFNVLFSFAHRNNISDAIIVFFAQYLTYLLVVAVLLLIAQRTFKHRIFFLCEIMLSVAVARGMITETFRFFYDSPRPFDALGIMSLIPESGNSFPSGHMTFLFAMLVAVYAMDRKTGILFGLSAFLVGIGRAVSGVHWPLDIVGGVIIGWGVGYIVHRLLAPYLAKLETPAILEPPQF